MAQLQNLGLTRYVYGVHFPEDQDDGYLLIKKLGEGQYGTTALVLSIPDGQIYVRKFEKHTNDRTSDAIQSPEEYSMPRSPGSDADTVKTTTTWQFCNGGDILNFWNRLHETHEWQLPLYGWSPDMDLRTPEKFIWKFMDNMLSALTACHSRGIVHNDFHEENVFLHWPPESKLPEAFVGDFGISVNYPWASHPIQRLKKPFLIDDLSAASTSQQGFPGATYRLQDLRDWYHRAVHDLSRVFEMAFQLMKAGPDDGGFEHSHLRIAAQQGRSMNGYSPELVQFLHSTTNLLSAANENLRPRILLRQMSQTAQLLRTTYVQIRPRLEVYLQDMNIMEALRPDLPHARPATWTSYDSVASYRNGLPHAVVSHDMDYDDGWELRLDVGQFEVRRLTLLGDHGHWDIMQYDDYTPDPSEGDNGGHGNPLAPIPEE